MIRLGLIGDPVEHSLSPAMHRAALEACGLEGEYALIPIAAGDRAALRHELQRVRAGEWQGLNVTIPHKRPVADLLDTLTPTAAAIGAVNTVVLQEGRLVGDNTDAAGFLEALRRFLDAHDRPEGTGQRALVLGAGGAARAVVYALCSSGWEVAVAARRVDQARALASDLANREVDVLDFHGLPAVADRVAPCSLVVNATPVGMHPHVDESPWPDGLPFPRQAALYDLVYVPGTTRLVRDARAAGMPAVTGLDMLIEQALLSFVRWTGHTPSRDRMLDAARRQLMAVS